MAVIKGELLECVLVQKVTAMSADNIDWSTGNIFTKTITDPRTFTFSNQKSGYSINVVITSSIAGAITWPVTIKWPGGAIPTQTVTGVDFYSFIMVGTVVYGFQAINMDV